MIVLNDTSLDKARQIRLLDLRRLLTGEWCDDELVNALIALAIVRSTDCEYDRSKTRDMRARRRTTTRSQRSYRIEQRMLMPTSYVSCSLNIELIRW